MVTTRARLIVMTAAAVISGVWTLATRATVARLSVLPTEIVAEGTETVPSTVTRGIETEPPAATLGIGTEVKMETAVRGIAAPAVSPKV